MTVGPADEPGSGRAPAPGALRLVQELINSSDLEEGTDELGQVQGLERWLAERGFRGGDVTEDDRQRVVAVREALRRLALGNNGGQVYPLDLAILNQVASENPLRVRFLAAGGARLEAQRVGVGAMLAGVLTSVQAAMSDGTWTRLKACRASSCQWAFFDHSKNHSGAWCKMAVCGNRTKARAYRTRQKRPGSLDAATAPRPNP